MLSKKILNNIWLSIFLHTMTLRNKTNILYKYTSWRKSVVTTMFLFITQNIIYACFVFDKVTEILIAYKPAQMSGDSRARAKEFSRGEISLLHSITTRARSIRQTCSTLLVIIALYCAMQLVRKSFSTRSRRAVFVRWPLERQRSLWTIRPGSMDRSRSIIGIVVPHSTRMKMRSFISIISVASSVNCHYVSISRCFQKRCGQIFSLQLLYIRIYCCLTLSRQEC